MRWLSIVAVAVILAVGVAALTADEAYAGKGWCRTCAQVATP